MRKLQLIALLCLTLISSQSIGQERLPALTQSGVLIDSADWEVVLFGFEYIHHLERTAEASLAEISRLDSIRLFMETLHKVDAAKLEEAEIVRTAMEEQLGMSEKEIRRQKRGKVWGSISAFLSGTGFGAIVGWVSTR